MLKKVVLLVSLAFVASPVLAAAPAEKPVDEKVTLSIELMKLVDFDKSMQGMQDQIRNMLEQQFESDSTCAVAKPVVKEFSAKLTEKMMGTMNDDSLKVDVAAIYSDVFSVEELRDIVAFYKSPLGRKMIQRMPELMQKSMQITQSRVKTMMPELQALGEEYAVRIRAASKSCAQDSEMTEPLTEE